MKTEWKTTKMQWWHKIHFFDVDDDVKCLKENYFEIAFTLLIGCKKKHLFTVLVETFIACKRDAYSRTKLILQSTWGTWGSPFGPRDSQIGLEISKAEYFSISPSLLLKQCCNHWREISIQIPFSNIFVNAFERYVSADTFKISLWLQLLFAFIQCASKMQFIKREIEIVSTFELAGKLHIGKLKVEYHEEHYDRKEA